MFAILTLYPQPTHLEYLPHPRGLAQAQHHPSIHPSTLFSTSPNLPIPILILNIPNLTHSLACFITPPPPPPNLPPPDPNSSSIPKQKKKKITRDERVASPSQLDRFFFFFFENTASCSFFSLCRSFKPIDIPLFHIDCSGF